MSEQTTIDYLLEEETTEETPTSETDKPLFLEGICPRCLDTTFVHDVKDGVLGVCYTSNSEDSSGHPIKKLMRCNHGANINI